MAELKEKYSYSKISTFESCKLKYKYAYLDKLYINDSPLVTRKGNAFHNSVDELAHIKDLTQEDAEKKIIENAAKYNISKDEAEKCKLLFGIDKWLEFKQAYIDKAVSFDTEKHYIYTFGKNQMTCVLDLIIKKENDAVWIFDYKTPSSKDSSRYMTQTNLYRYFYSKLSSVPLEKIHSFIFYPLVQQKMESSIEETTMDAEQTALLIQNVAKTMADMKLFNPEGVAINDLKSEGFGCMFCQYANTIPDLKKGYRGCITTESKAQLHKAIFS